MIQGINPFVILVDNQGSAVEVLSANSTIDYIFEMVGIHDRQHPDDAPHLAFEWCDGYFKRLDDTHPVVSTREVKLRNLGFEDLTEEQLANIRSGRSLI